MVAFGLLLDILLIVLLGVAIFFIMRLHRRMEVLRSGRHDLETLLNDLVHNTGAAEHSLREMRGSAGALADTLQKQVRGAENAREELEFLLSSAEQSADQLMARVSEARQVLQAAPVSAAPAYQAAPVAPQAQQHTQQQPTASVKADSATLTEAREKAEDELLRAIEKLR